MGYRRRRKVWNVSGSRVIALPPHIEIGEQATLAADRLVLIDPRGEIHERELLRLLEGLEPAVWKFLAKRHRDVKR